MDTRFEKIDALFAPFDRTASPGCSMAVIQNGQIIYSRGYGMANLENNIPNQPWTRFYLASMSKQFTAFCIALLEEEGKLHLDDDIRKYIPEIPQYQAPITIQHLVHHTSGLRDYLGLGFLSGRPYDDIIVEAETLDLLARQKELNFTPGDEYLYSNSGYILLAMIVARVSGKSFRQYADENIFRPLGMVHTHVHDNHLEPVPQRATAYQASSNGYLISIPNFDMVGDGGIYSSVEDLYLWDQNFYHNRLGKGRQELIERVLSCEKLANGEKNLYAFGLLADEYKGLKEVSHSGGYGGYHTQMIRYPEHNLSVVILGNHGDLASTDLARQVAGIFLPEYFLEAEKQQKNEVFASQSVLEGMTGLYYGSQNGMSIEICMKNGSMNIVVGDSSAPIHAIASDRFISDISGMKVTGTFIGTKLELTMGTAKPIRYESIPVVSPSLVEKADFTGDYFSEELQTSCIIYLDNENLIFKIRNHKETIKPGSRDMYLFSQGAFFIERSNREQITGFNVQAGRVRNIRFVRG